MGFKSRTPKAKDCIMLMQVVTFSKKVTHISPHAPMSDATKELVNKIAEKAYNSKQK